MQKSVLAIVIVVVALVIIGGSVGYLLLGNTPVKYTPHYAFPSNKNVTKSSGSNKTYSSNNTPQKNTSSLSFSAFLQGAVTNEVLTYINGSSGADISIMEIQFSNSNDADHSYNSLITGYSYEGGASLSHNASTYHGFSYEYGTLSAFGSALMNLSFGYNGNFMFFIIPLLGNVNINAISQVTMNAMTS